MIMLRFSDETPRWTRTAQKPEAPIDILSVNFDQRRFWELFPSACETLLRSGNIPRTAFQLYVAVWEPIVRSTYSGAAMGTVRTLCSQNWRNVPLVERNAIKEQLFHLKNHYNSSISQSLAFEKESVLTSNPRNATFQDYFDSKLYDHSFNNLSQFNQTNYEDFGFSMNSEMNDNLHTPSNKFSDEAFFDLKEFQNPQHNNTIRQSYSNLSSPQYFSNTISPYPNESKTENSEIECSPQSINGFNSVEREEQNEMITPQQHMLFCHYCGSVIRPNTQARFQYEMNETLRTSDSSVSLQSPANSVDSSVLNSVDKLSLSPHISATQPSPNFPTLSELSKPFQPTVYQHEETQRSQDQLKNKEQLLNSHPMMNIQFEDLTVDVIRANSLPRNQSIAKQSTRSKSRSISFTKTQPRRMSYVSCPSDQKNQLPSLPLVGGPHYKPNHLNNETKFTKNFNNEFEQKRIGKKTVRKTKSSSNFGRKRDFSDVSEKPKQTAVSNPCMFCQEQVDEAEGVPCSRCHKIFHCHCVRTLISETDPNAQDTNSIDFSSWVCPLPHECADTQ